MSRCLGGGFTDFAAYYIRSISPPQGGRRLEAKGVATDLGTKRRHGTDDDRRPVYAFQFRSAIDKRSTN